MLHAAAVAAAEPGAALDEARRLAASRPRLALEQVVAYQPRDPRAPLWADWEGLRCRLHDELGEHRELLVRAAALPADMPGPRQVECLLPAARAAVSSGAASLARQHAARALWQLSPAAEAVQALRLVVIDSYVAEGRGDAALRSMLRYQQDHRPLERGVATRFTEALLGLGMEKDAVNWLAALDDAGPAKLLLRLRTGLIAPEAAVAQARALLAKSGDSGHWRVIADAAQREKNAALESEAAEQLLQASRHPPAGLARRLWDLYLVAAREAANAQRLLVGDDANLADLAARRAATQPVLSRALYAHLARHAQAAESRLTAQLQLVYSLHADRLERAALRIAEASGIEPDVLDRQARYLVGLAAEKHDEPDAAWRYWRGLDAPPGLDGATWALRTAHAAFRAGAPDAAMAAVRRAGAARSALAPDAGQLAARLAGDMLDAGKADLARETLEILLPIADNAAARRMHYALARVHERAGNAGLAAQNYLRSALLFDGRTPDAPAIDARLKAGLNLARAGQRDEARAQFDWVLKQSKDAAQVDVARRELARLQAAP